MKEFPLPVDYRRISIDPEYIQPTNGIYIGLIWVDPQIIQASSNCLKPLVSGYHHVSYIFLYQLYEVDMLSMNQA
jgi:hypothetical protein